MSATKCPRCQSTNFIRKGYRKTKRGKVRRYKCKDCPRKFVNDPLYHKQVSLVDLCKIFQWAVDNVTYYDIGLRIGVSPQTVSALIKYYVKLLLRFESSLKLRIGGTWQMDDVHNELTRAWTQFYELNTLRKGKRRLTSKKQRWILNVIDEDTLYWLAAIASPRNKSAAMKALNSSVNRARRFPERIKGDDFVTYPLACNTILPTSVTRDFKCKKKKEAYGHTYAVERLNRTLRKSLPAGKRRFRSLGALQNYVELVRLYYNFIHSNIGLNGGTPAEAAGVTCLCEKKWSSLITLAYDYSSGLERSETFKLPIVKPQCDKNLGQTSIDDSLWQNPTLLNAGWIDPYGS